MYRSFLKTIKSSHGYQTKARGKDLTHKNFILGMDDHSLIKVAHMFNMIGLTIINGKSGSEEGARPAQYTKKKGSGISRGVPFPWHRAPGLSLVEF